MNYEKRHKKLTPVLYLFIAIAIAAIFATKYIYSVPLNYPPIRSDGHGYYMYLPAFFIYKDPKMQFLNQIDDVGSFATTYFQSNTGAMIDKYTMGTAILQSPFFLITHLITSVTSPEQATGFSRYYQWANIISACFWYVVGAWFSFKSACKFAKREYAALAVLLCTIGSNLFHYISYDASFSHVYSFALISIFVYLIIKTEGLSEKSRLGYFILGLCFGIIVLIRVTDVTIIMLYGLYGVSSFKSFIKRIKFLITPKRIIPLVIGAIIAFSPQIIYWYTMSGNFFLNSYGETDPGFAYWNNPKIFEVLFLVERGIFFWCPVLLIGVVGGVIQKEKMKNIFLPICLFFTMYVYVISSWWSYTLAGGYSHRIFVNIMSLFIIFMSVTLEKLDKTNKIFKISIRILLFFAILWNILCMYAYWRGIISFGGYHLIDIVNIFKWYLNL